MLAMVRSVEKKTKKQNLEADWTVTFKVDTSDVLLLLIQLVTGHGLLLVQGATLGFAGRVKCFECLETDIFFSGGLLLKSAKLYGTYRTFLQFLCDYSGLFLLKGPHLMNISCPNILIVDKYITQTPLQKYRNIPLN